MSNITLAYNGVFNCENIITNNCTLFNLNIKDETDNTKEQNWNLSGAMPGTGTTLAFVQSVNRTISFPDATATLVGQNTTDNLSNKSIVDTTDITKKQNWDLSGATTGTSTTLAFNQTTNKIISFPNATDTLVGKNTVDNLSNKSIVDAIDATKKQNWNLSGATTGTSTTLAFNQSSNKIISFPDATDILIGKSTVDDLSNKSIVDALDATKKQNWNLSGATTGTSTTLAFNQSSNKIISFPDATDILIGKSTVDDLSNKSIVDALDATKKQNWNLSGATTGTNTTLAFNQTTNKIISFPDATDILVGKSTIDNLSNKSIVDALDVTKKQTWDLSSMTTNTNMNFKFNNTADRVLNFQDVDGTVALVANSNTRHIFFTSGVNAPTGGSISFLTQGSGLQIDETFAQYMLPFAGNITKMDVFVPTAPGAGANRELDIRLNAINIGNATVSDNNTTAVFTGNYPFTAGMLISIKHVNTGIPAVASVVFATLTYVVV